MSPSPTNTLSAGTASSQSPVQFVSTTGSSEPFTYSPGITTFEQNGQVFVRDPNGSTYLVDTSAGLGNSNWQQTNQSVLGLLNIVDKLKQSSNTNTKKLAELAITGMVLANRQYQVSNGADKHIKGAADPTSYSRFAKQTGVKDLLDYLTVPQDGNRTPQAWKSGSNCSSAGGCPFNNTAYSALGALDTAHYFEELYVNTIHPDLSAYGLTQSDQLLVQQLSQQIIDNAAIFTTPNAHQTQKNSLTIDQCGTGSCQTP
jgi:hypothetical protein